MVEKGVTERLVAVLAADVASYSRLMQEDRHGTLAALDACRDLFHEKVNAHGGRVVDTAGDSVLSAFDLATEALQAAVEIQEGLEGRDTSLPLERRMRFRIGVHVGEVMQKADGTIYGDGVNIAARLQAMAKPGGICVSDTVRGAVTGRVESAFVDLGEHEIKNIAEPVHAYQVTASSEDTRQHQRARPSSKSWTVGVGAAALATIMAAVALWTLPEGEDPSPSSGIESQTAEPEAVNATKERGPSIAVLPFTNMSDDAAQEYFADGISEDLITELSRFEGLLVIARNSTFRFKGQAVDVSEVGEALGVRWVLEGGVRRMGDRVRVTAQLIDTETGGHLWAERYDRDMTDVFAVQDVVTRQIIAALKTEIGDVIPTRATKPLTSSHEAYDFLLRARVEKEKRSAEANRRTRELLTQAITLDPTFAAAYAELSDAQYLAWNYEWDANINLDVALATAEKAVALDRSLPVAHVQYGRRLMWLQRFDAAMEAINAAIALDSNFAAAFAAHSYLSVFTADYHLSVAMAQKAARLDPYAVRPAFYSGMALFALRDYEPAIKVMNDALSHNESFLAFHIWNAAAYAHLGRMDEATRSLDIGIQDGYNHVLGTLRQPFVDQAIFENLIDGLRLVGYDGPVSADTSK